MRALGILLSTAAVVTLIGAGSAQEKKATNKEKIIGTWDMVKSVPKAFWKQGTIEFTKDGKFTLAGKVDGKAWKIEGTYEVDDDKLTMRQKDNIKEVEGHTIKALKEKDMVWEDKMGDKIATAEFKRVK
jgi:uncharacterized protein (TIGR03066 family)